jgi:NAD(P)-dependent dehydrogenase (short-subunit alcohol dehydrogenase family)
MACVSDTGTCEGCLHKQVPLVVRLPCLQARATFAINYHGTAAITEALLPLLADNTGRIVNVSSRAGLSSIIKDPKLRDR